MADGSASASSSNNSSGPYRYSESSSFSSFTVHHPGQPRVHEVKRSYENSAGKSKVTHERSIGEKKMVQTWEKAPGAEAKDSKALENATEEEFEPLWSAVTAGEPVAAIKDGKKAE